LDKALDGVVVVEQAGRLAASICGSLLAELGATVIRVESDAAGQAAPVLALPGKQRIATPANPRDAAALWRELAARADVVILSPCDAARAAVESAAAHAVVCYVSAYGMAQAANAEAPDWAIQADSGMMAVTGEAGGPPQATRAPIFEVYAGINAATSIIAALRVCRRDGVGQTIDIALFDAAFAMLGTHVAAALAGKPRGHRVGCRHPLCAPWDVYRCGDDSIQICIASEAQWQRFVALMDKPALLADERFASSGSRVANGEALNRIVQDWLASQDSTSVAERLHAVGISAAKVERIGDVLAAFAARGALSDVEHGNRRGRRMRSVLRLSRTPGAASTVIAPPADAAALLAHLPAKAAGSTRPPRLPLDDIKVIEIGPYTAGPLAGRYLAGLGARVLKIEPARGEDSRRFQPRFGSLSGFFSNYNCGKQAIFLELDKPDDRDRLIGLLEDCDVVLQNLKPGALDRLGIDLTAIAARNPRLIACSISGYGADGPPQPALDTVIQAQAGVMSRIGDGSKPVKSGFSLADLIAAHVAPLAIVAALHYRDSNGQGQHIDISMLDCLVWALQPVWDEAEESPTPIRIIAAADGHVAVACPARSETTVDQFAQMTPRPMRQELLAGLALAGLEAAAVRELDEVLGRPDARRHMAMLEVEPGLDAPILTSPYRLSLTPPVLGRPISLGGDQGLRS
jgi:crotonobetainyl-CoA:carnitine CoA-transferase CaiB-like acyl-CoA transferase